MTVNVKYIEYLHRIRSFVKHSSMTQILSRTLIQNLSFNAPVV